MAAAFRVWRPGLVGGLVATALLAFAAAAGANTYVPNKTSDHAPNGCTHHDCTLREAVIKSNGHTGRDTIVLASRKPYTLQIAPVGPDDATTGNLDITDPVTIEHRRRGRAVVDADHIDNVFHLSTPDSARYTKLSRLVIRGGGATAFGGGIELGNGLLGLSNSVVTGNAAIIDGGGIYATAGELTLVKSTVRGNQAGSNGGGVLSTVETVIRGSTISGNTAAVNAVGGGGGGILHDVESLRMANDTVANNRTNGSGGGIFNYGTARLNNVTVARNVADSDNDATGLGAGLYNANAFTVGNSIVALNRYGNGNTSDCSGSFTSAGVNLFTSLVGCGGFSTPPNIVTANPRLGSLADNGGRTKTIALRKGSPAIGKAAKATAENRDQRGVKRDKHPDIGAFER